jgi:hypothetical protein
MDSILAKGNIVLFRVQLLNTELKDVVFLLHQAVVRTPVIFAVRSAETDVCSQSPL